MSMMFFSNLLHRKRKIYPDTEEDTTIIMCARNEEGTVGRAIQAILNQQYAGSIRLIVVDNGSTDRTKAIIQKYTELTMESICVEYVYCSQPGKANALNLGLEMVCTPHFLTVDADTYLEEHALQQIMNHIVYRKCACAAGNLFVDNVRASLTAKMQNYDYLLSIAATKRFLGSYKSTLVAQGAFSAYETEAVREVGGWKAVQGEDIVLTYQLLQRGGCSTYESGAVGYTTVPEH